MQTPVISTCVCPDNLERKNIMGSTTKDRFVGVASIGGLAALSNLLKYGTNPLSTGSK